MVTLIDTTLCGILYTKIPLAFTPPFPSKPLLILVEYMEIDFGEFSAKHIFTRWSLPELPYLL